MAVFPAGGLHDLVEIDADDETLVEGLAGLVDAGVFDAFEVTAESADVVTFGVELLGVAPLLPLEEAGRDGDLRSEELQRGADVVGVFEARGERGQRLGEERFSEAAVVGEGVDFAGLDVAVAGGKREFVLVGEGDDVREQSARGFGRFMGHVKEWLVVSDE